MDNTTYKNVKIHIKPCHVWSNASDYLKNHPNNDNHIPIAESVYNEDNSKWWIYAEIHNGQIDISFKTKNLYKSENVKTERSCTETIISFIKENIDYSKGSN